MYDVGGGVGRAASSSSASSSLPPRPPPVALRSGPGPPPVELRSGPWSVAASRRRAGVLVGLGLGRTVGLGVGCGNGMTRGEGGDFRTTGPGVAAGSLVGSGVGSPRARSSVPASGRACSSVPASASPLARPMATSWQVDAGDQSRRACRLHGLSGNRRSLDRGRRRPRRHDRDQWPFRRASFEEHNERGEQDHCEDQPAADSLTGPGRANLGQDRCRVLLERVLSEGLTKGHGATGARMLPAPSNFDPPRRSQCPERRSSTPAHGERRGGRRRRAITARAGLRAAPRPSPRSASHASPGASPPRSSR